MAKPIVKLRQTQNRQLRRHHASSRLREPLKISARQQAQLLWEQNRLSDRDINLIRAFIAVGMLTRHQIQRLFFRNHEKMAANRLAKLYHQHFLDRTLAWGDEMREMGLPACYVYTASRVGLEAYALCTSTPFAQIPFRRERYLLTRQNHKMLHDLQISEMFTRLQVGMGGKGYELTWYNEWATILRQGEEELVRPDGGAILEQAGSGVERGYFIEMDRGNTNWEKKVRYYERARQQSPWQALLQVQHYPTVLCVVPEGVQAEAILAVGQQRPTTRYLFKTWERFLAEDVQEDWIEPLTASKSGRIE